MGDARQRHTLRSGIANVLAQYRPHRFARYCRSVHVRLQGNATQHNSIKYYVLTHRGMARFRAPRHDNFGVKERCICWSTLHSLLLYHTRRKRLIILFSVHTHIPGKTSSRVSYFVSTSFLLSLVETLFYIFVFFFLKIINSLCFVCFPPFFFVFCFCCFHSLHVCMYVNVLLFGVFVVCVSLLVSSFVWPNVLFVCLLLL